MKKRQKRWKVGLAFHSDDFIFHLNVSIWFHYLITFLFFFLFIVCIKRLSKLLFHVLSESVKHVFDHCRHSMLNFPIFFWFVESTLAYSKFCVWQKKNWYQLCIAYQHMFDVRCVNRRKKLNYYYSIDANAIKQFYRCLNHLNVAFFPSIFNSLCFYSPFVVLLYLIRFIFLLFLCP